MTATKIIPEGYRENANGDLVSIANIKPIDSLRDQVVVDLCTKAEAHAAELARFKAFVMGEIGAFTATSLERYGVRLGREKGNITLISFDGRFKIVRQMQDHIAFGEELQAAKTLIDECVVAWAADSNDNIKSLVTHAFQTDAAGKINLGRVLSLRQLDIKDEKWADAMKAIADSMRVTGTKPYVRFYKRNDAGEYMPISLDMAAL